MNLKELFEVQRKLDERIEQEHPRQDGEDRLGKKILALQVELGELANELPEVFKFWSNKKNNREKALSEYVDGLHFVLSIGVELDIEPFEGWVVSEQSTITHQFNEVFYRTGIIDFLNQVSKVDQTDFEVFTAEFLTLGKELGFGWEEVEQAYMSKNAINHARQENGY